jgi:UDP-N-acetylglucosamine 2-epimerase
MKIIHVVGTRPSFMKVAHVFRAVSRKDGVSQLLVHIEQHYNVNNLQQFEK